MHRHVPKFLPEETKELFFPKKRPKLLNPFLPNVAFNICCPRDCVSRYNGGTADAPLKPLRDDSALRALSTLRGLRGAPVAPTMPRDAVSRTANVERNVGQKWVKVAAARNDDRSSTVLILLLVHIYRFRINFKTDRVEVWNWKRVI